MNSQPATPSDMTESDGDLQSPQAKKAKIVFASKTKSHAPQSSSPVLPPTPQLGTTQRAFNVNGSMGGTQNLSMPRGSSMDDGLIDPIQVGALH